MTKKKFFALVSVFILIVISAALIISMRYPIKYFSLIKENAGELEPSLILAVILTESSFREDAKSHRGAQGLMQLMPATAEETAALMGMTEFAADDIWRPEVNIALGSFYLNRLLSRYGSIESALAAYNAGQGNVTRWLADTAYSHDGANLDVIPFPETENYLKRVRQNQRIYNVILFLTGRAR